MGFQVCDGLHDGISRLLVDGLESIFAGDFGLCPQMFQVQYTAELNFNRMKPWPFHVSAIGLESAEDPDRKNGGIRFDGQESNPRFGLSQSSVKASSAFREKNDWVACFQSGGNDFQASGAFATPVNWDHVDIFEKRTKDGEAEQRVPGKIGDFSRYA